MVYLLIGAVILLIVGPIIAVLPSKRQREQMAMRKKAMAAGVSIEFTSIEDPDPDPEKYLSNTGKPLERIMRVVAYRVLRPKPSSWRQMPRIDWCAVRTGASGSGELPDGWQWANQLPAEMSNELRSFLVNGLQKMPNDVVRVDEVRFVISAYWNERGGDEDLSIIMDFLSECAGINPVKPMSESDDSNDQSE
ncbi:MAG: hypothetical protein HUJ31_11330 [Pseudomonadales bacterium]|nr:hypothetical protein [Pseudomonadales bacterium]